MRPNKGLAWLNNRPTRPRHERDRPSLPAEFPDIVSWAAWLYFVDELTQSEVAEAIGVSRVTVIRLLNDAKEKGLVSVRINPQLASRVGISRRISEIWGLNSTIVVPDNPRISLVEQIGQAGAFVLVDSLKPGDVIGVAWGRTVLAATHSIELEAPIPDLTVVQVSASPNGLSADFSPELCVSLTANKLGARSVNLMAPAIVYKSRTARHARQGAGNPQSDGRHPLSQQGGLRRRPS